MNPYPPPNAPYGQPPPQGYHASMPTSEDDSQLNVLAICHFVYAGLLGLAGLFGLLYVLFGILFVAAAASGGGTSGGGAPPAAVGGIIAAVGGFIMLLVWTKAGLVLYSGLSLRKRLRRNFSFVIACLCCINIPLGALLGVFTIVVLSRASVKALYERVAYYGA